MDIINKPVLHKTFGKGKICDITDQVVTVHFANQEKKFVFPDAFREHLILSDAGSRKYVEKVISEIDMAKRKRFQKEILEAEHKKLLKSLPLNDNAQAAFGCIHNDAQKVIEEQCVFTGNYRSGKSVGQPRVASKLYPNSVCLLTARSKKEHESSRYIWGAFMVRDDFEGAKCKDGIIRAHDKYQIFLSGNEEKKLLFWKHFEPTSNSSERKWGSVEFKYFANSTMAYILCDIYKLKQDTNQKKLCEQFINYFCELNNIDKKLLKLSHQKD